MKICHCGVTVIKVGLTYLLYIIYSFYVRVIYLSYKIVDVCPRR